MTINRNAIGTVLALTGLAGPRIHAAPVPLYVPEARLLHEGRGDYGVWASNMGNCTFTKTREGHIAFLPLTVPRPKRGGRLTFNSHSPFPATALPVNTGARLLLTMRAASSGPRRDLRTLAPEVGEEV